MIFWIAIIAYALIGAIVVGVCTVIGDEDLKSGEVEYGTIVFLGVVWPLTIMVLLGMVLACWWWMDEDEEDEDDQN